MISSFFLLAPLLALSVPVQSSSYVVLVFASYRPPNAPFLATVVLMFLHNVKPPSPALLPPMMGNASILLESFNSLPPTRTPLSLNPFNPG